MDPTLVGGLPSLLYHYTSAQGLIGVLENKHLLTA